MAGQTETRRIFISACDPSADIHCAKLITAVNQKLSGTSIEWVGVGGAQMGKAGCQIMENTVSRAAMLNKPLGQIGFYYKVIKRISAYFADNKVDLTIVCDSPAFNFHVAKAAKKHGCKVLWYVAPQLWAWASWRIYKLRRRCDRLACILPFEKAWFAKRDLEAEFVGNPLFDGLSIDIADSYKDYADFNPGRATIALMPGSRDAEIDSLWPAMQKIAMMIKNRWPRAKFVASAVDDKTQQVLESKEVKGFTCEYAASDVASVARGADLTLVASGSATLQVAAAGCPMVIMYQSSRILWHLLGPWLVKTRFLSLVNILAGKELVSEFMPYFNSIKPIFQRCNSLLSVKSRLARTSRELVELVEPLARGNASEKVAQMAAEMLESA